MADRSARSTGGSHSVDTGDRDTPPVDSHRESRSGVVEREKAEHGGLKIGATFFGWMTATGMAVLLTALVAAAGTVVGLASDTKAGKATKTATQEADTIGIVGGIVLLVVLFVAYFCGGYVAGRMARFDGLKQGLGVWLWALVVAVIVAVLGAVLGAEFNVLKELNSFPRIPVDEGTLTTGGIIALVAFVLVTLGGALLGGLAGMRFHRKVDETDLGR